MSMTERAIKARMMHKLTDEEAEDLVTIDTHVITRMFDMYGNMMDSRTAVLYVLTTKATAETHEVVVAGSSVARVAQALGAHNDVLIVRQSNAADLVAKL